MMEAKPPALRWQYTAQYGQVLADSSRPIHLRDRRKAARHDCQHRVRLSVEQWIRSRHYHLR